MMVKKIILFSVALILSVTFIVLALSGSTIATAGVGGGKSEHLTNVGELSLALSAIESYGTTETENRVSATLLLSENVKLKETYYPNGSAFDATADSYRTHKRDLAVYYGEDAVYYKSSGMFTYKYDYVDQTQTDTRSIMEFDLEAYVSADGCYVKINKLISTTDTTTRQLRGAYEGEWISVTQDIIEYLIISDIIDIAPTYEHTEMLGLLMSEDLIDDNDTTAKLDEDACHEYFNSIYPSDEYTVGFDYSIDFSDEDATRLCTYLKVREGDFWSPISTGRTESTLIVKDVGNTYVSLDVDRISAEANDMDDFDDMFIIKERSNEAND